MTRRLMWASLVALCATNAVGAQPETPVPLDTHAAVEDMEDGGFTEEEAEAITRAIVEAASQSVPRDEFRIMAAENRALIAENQTALVQWMAGLVFAAAGLVIGAVALFNRRERDAMHEWLSDNFGVPLPRLYTAIRDLEPEQLKHLLDLLLKNRRP